MDLRTVTVLVILFAIVSASCVYSTAWSAYRYPVILSIENHCSVEQQHVMAQYMIDIFGDMLHSERRDENRPSLPSPEELKYKILIKVMQFTLGICMNIQQTTDG